MKNLALLCWAVLLTWGANVFGGTITGTVIDSTDGHPLNQALVASAYVHYDSAAYTDTNGKFTFAFTNPSNVFSPKNNSSRPSFYWDSRGQNFSWRGNSGLVSLKIIDTRGRVVAAFRESSPTGKFRINTLATSSYLGVVDFQGESKSCQLLSISGQLTAIKNSRANFFSAALAKSTADGTIIYVAKCGYITKNLSVVEGEQNLVISLVRAESFFPCPTNSDTIRCLTTAKLVPFFSYGQWMISNEGNNGTASSCTRLITDCRWSIYKNNMGGYGGTYQVVSPDSSAIFIWSYNTFSEFIATSKWQGQTREGARIGDSAAKFISLYPSFQLKRDSLQRIVSATLPDSFIFFNRLDTIWRAHAGDTVFMNVDTSYLDTTKKYYYSGLFGTEADFDSLSRLNRLTCWQWQKF